MTRYYRTNIPSFSIPTTSGYKLDINVNQNDSLNAKFGAQFTSVNSEQLTSSSASFDVGATPSFSIGGWVYLDSVGTIRGVVGKWEAGTNTRSYLLRVNAGNTFSLFVSSNGTTATTIATTTGTISVNTWVFLVATYEYVDGVNNVVKIYLNGSVDANTTTNIEPYQAGSPALLRMGSVDSGFFWNGRMDSMFFYSKALSGTEVTDLYNSGSGLDYYDLSGSLLTSLAAWWRLNEQSGDRVDVSGNSNTLTDVNTVTYQLGHVREFVIDGDYVWKITDIGPSLYEFTEVAAADQAQYDSTGMGGSSLPRLDFDGTTDYYPSDSGALFGADTDGSIFIVIKHTTGVTQYPITFSDENTDNYFVFGIDGNEAVITSRVAGASNTVSGGTTLTNGATYIISYHSNGSVWTIRVNQVDESLTVDSGTNNGNWIGDVSGYDTTNIGRLRANSVSTFYNLDVSRILIFSPKLDSGKTVNVEKTLNKTFGAY